MFEQIILLGLVSFAIAFVATRLVRSLSLRWNFVDKPGQRKIHQVPQALGGGIAIVCGIALPLIAGLIYIHLQPQSIARYSLDIQQGTRQAAGFLLAMLTMHALGLRDDRSPLGPFFKLVIQLAIITALVVGLNLRALTVLDKLGVGTWPSYLISILWIGLITNAFNFLDNMDGLSAGVAVVCSVAFLVTALSIGQWFVAAMLALLIGALLGFLCFNFPPATIFMGDSGSLVVGLTLGVLTIRTTYLPVGQRNAFWEYWYTMLVPIVVLAVPLYDFLVVSIIRIRRGKSPFVGDTNHFSHRLVARGMSRRTSVLCIYLVTAATSVAAILLPRVESQYAPLIFVQTLLVLGCVALLEQHPTSIA